MDSTSSPRSSFRRTLEELERRDTPAFTALPTFTAGITLPTVIASADFNGDGFADVAIGNGPNSFDAHYVGIALGKGDGSFTEIQQLTNAQLQIPQAIVVGKFNADNLPDLAVASFDPNSQTGSVLVFLGQADGSFAGPSFQDLTPAIAVGVADFTGDGKADLVALNPSSGSLLGGYQIFAGNGDGTFALASSVSNLNFDVNRVATGDLDRDTFADFVALDSSNRLIYTFFGDGTGNFVVPNGSAALNARAIDVIAGDFNNDTLPDLVISTDAGVKFLQNLGSRLFDFVGVNVTSISGTTPARLATTDFNRDGVPDLVATDPQQARVFYGTNFTEDPTSPFALPGITAQNDVATGDVNGDGNPDFIVARQDSDGGPPSDGTVFLNLVPIPTTTLVTANPDPGIESGQTLLSATVGFTGTPFPASSVPTGNVTFEVDNITIGSAPLVNGVATIPNFFVPGTHTIIARYPGDSTFLPSVSPPFSYLVFASQYSGTTYEYEVTGLPTLPGRGADRVASGSFTPDGVSDIALGSGPGRVAELSIIDGKSRQEITSVMPFGPEFTGGLMVAAGDIDGDGVSDVAVAADVGGGPRVTLYLTRDGRLERTNNFFALDENFRGGLRIALGDIDGDGLADLVVTGGPGAGPRVATYDGRTLTNFQTPERLFNDFFAMDSNLRLGMFVAVGDLNRDGYAEIAVAPEFGGGPRIAIFDGKSLLDNEPDRVANFFAGNPDARGGLRIAIRDISNFSDGVDLEVMAGDGPGAGSTVRVYSGYTSYHFPPPPPLITTELLPGYLGGVFVA